MNDFVNQYLLQYYHNLSKKNNGLRVSKIRGKYFIESCLNI